MGHPSRSRPVAESVQRLSFAAERNPMFHQTAYLFLAIGYFILFVTH